MYFLEIFVISLTEARRFPFLLEIPQQSLLQAFYRFLVEIEVLFNFDKHPVLDHQVKKSFPAFLKICP